ncbi:MAG: hypothetical protein AB8B49_00650 [Nitratireductor sp.]
MEIEKMLKVCFNSFVLVLLQFAIVPVANAQQVAIEGFSFENQNPAWEQGSGPKVLIDRAVSPYVQRGSFEPFKILAQTDGYQISYLDENLSKDTLDKLDILVIPNAYTKDFINFSTLDAPSVYTDAQIDEIKNWVQEGGSMLVLADHSPFAGGTIKLAEAFGFTYMTGHTLNKSSLSSRVNVLIDFSRENGLLADHPITNGSTGRQKITHFFAFGGQAIIAAPESTSILTTPDHFETLLGFSASRDFFTAPRLPTGGQSQGAAMEFGKGRVMFMGETGGFTAQILNNTEAYGFQSEEADENKEFILATLRWLAKFTP